MPTQLPNHPLKGMLEEIANEVLECNRFLEHKASMMPLVFRFVHGNEGGAIVQFLPTNRLYALNYIGKHAKDSDSTSATSILDKYEMCQPHFAIGSYNEGESLEKATSEFKKGNAVWHTTPIGIPITRLLEEIIKMDYGMKTFGSFI